MATPRVGSYCAASVPGATGAPRHVFDGNALAIEARGHYVVSCASDGHVSHTVPRHVMHAAYVRMVDRDRAFYAWHCVCGARSADRDFPHAEYARDDWRETHMGLEPVITYPLV